jgi:hypothetical protein
LEEENMNMATQKGATLNPGNDKLRLHGWTMGLILLVASLLVASSVTAVINFILIAIPVLTMLAVAAMFFMGIPMVAAGINAGREARVPALSVSPVLLGRNGNWKHTHAWDSGHHPHFLAFQPVDRNIVIHLDSESDNYPMTMGEFMRMNSSSSTYKGRGMEHTLEGLTNWRRY